MRHRALYIVLLLLTACGHAIQLDSRWRDREIVIDGADQDWGQARYILEDLPISLGVMNDGDHLYLTMLTADRDLQTLVATRGLEIWIDPDGGRKHVFGLRLTGAMRPGQHGEPFDGMAPWGRDGSDGALIGSGRTGIRRPGPGGSTRSLDPRQLAAMFEQMHGSSVFVLDSPEDDGWETTATVADALQVSITYETGRLVYEARLPLTYLGHPHYAMAASTESRIGLGLKVPTRESLRPEQGGMRDGGRGGIGGMVSPGRSAVGGGRGGFDSRGLSPEEVFEQWARIRLAEAD